MSAPHLAQTFEEPGAQRVGADAFDYHVRSRNDQRRDQRERGPRTGRPGTTIGAGGKPRGKPSTVTRRPPFSSGSVVTAGAEVTQHALGMITRRLGLDDGGFSPAY